jgi:glycosyltransferase involved in cell wall biosynthesis
MAREAGLMARERPRVLLLWHSLTGYIAAGVRALADRADVTIVARPPDPLAPFDYAALDLNGAELLIEEPPLTSSFVDALVDRTRPDIVCGGGRQVAMLRSLHRARRRHGTTTVMVTDFVWSGTRNQRALQALFTVIRPYAYEAALVPGVRSSEYVRRLGFSSERTFTGLFTIDRSSFASLADGSAARWAEPRFLFCGRLVPEKAPDVLADAYRIYCQGTDDPWPLEIVGQGPFDGGLTGVPGVIMRGFVQPDALPGFYADAGALILPSRFDCWGVVALEACAAGLPVVISDGCGAADDLVTPANGLTVPVGDAASLASALTTVARAGRDQREDWGRASRAIADGYTPDQWADGLLSICR